MRLIIVSQDVAAICLLKTMLLKAAHNVEVFDCAERAHQANAACPADCILTDWLLPGVDGIELARRVKRDAGPPLIMMSELATPEARHHAMRAGAFAYVLKPLYPQSVVSAILAVRKTSAIRRATVAREVFDSRLMKQPVWTKYDVLVTEWLRGCTGTTLDKAPEGLFVPAEDDYVTSLSMIDIATSVELEFSIRASRESVGALARLMLGIDELDAASALDLLAELCNNLLGQAKTNLQAGGFDFSLATPDKSKPQGPAKPATATQRAIELLFGEGILQVALRARIVPPMLVRARELVENMVVMDDILSPQGALLVPAGTRLTSVTAERVTRYLADREVRVAMLG